MSLTTNDNKYITIKDFKTSSLCNIYYTPRLITGMVIDTLRQHYADNELIEEKNLKDAIFKNNDSTDILIQEVSDWRPQNTQKRPAIIVARGRIEKSKEKRSIGNRLHLEPDTFAAVFTGSLDLFCIANTGAQAELLATDVYKNLLYFSSFYKSTLNLAWWDLDYIEKISKIEEAQEHYCVPVRMDFGYYDIWRIAKNDVPIRSITVSAYID